MMIIKFHNRVGTVLSEQHGRWLVRWADTYEVGSVLKGIEGVELWQRRSVGRPKQHNSNAEKQRAYRLRQKALRNSLKQQKTG